MQIVIDIPKENYEDIIDNGVAGSHLALLHKALVNCTPLPKGHGRIEDADTIALVNEDFIYLSDYIAAECAVDNAPTIIEADKE